MFKRSTIFFVFCVIICQCQAGNKVKLRTESGSIKGYIENGIEHYLGVPYANPPVGDKRFYPSEYVDRWRKVRRALTHAPICIQAVGGPAVYPGLRPGAIHPTSEDCLYLDIYRNVNTPDNAPIMVFFPGGGFVGGADSTSVNGAEMARKYNVIVIAVTSRINTLGSLTYVEENVWLSDLITSLQWINNNAEVLGSSEDRITVFGNSAGAISIGYLLLDERAEGLFNRAIMISGGGWSYKTREQIDQFSSDLAASFNCTGDEQEVLCCMQQLDAEDVFQPSFIGASEADGKPLLQRFSEAETLNAEELIIGTAYTEGGAFVSSVYWNAFGQEIDPEVPLTPLQFQIAVGGGLLGFTNYDQATVGAIVGYYMEQGLSFETAALAYTEILFRCGMQLTKELANTKVYTYLFDVNSENLVHPFLETSHGITRPYLFSDNSIEYPGYISEFSYEDEVQSNIFGSLFTAFANGLEPWFLNKTAIFSNNAVDFVDPLHIPDSCSFVLGSQSTSKRSANFDIKPVSVIDNLL